MIVLVRQWKLQRERLQADFTKALDNFQRAQRSAAQKEKDAIKKYKNQGVSCWSHWDSCPLQKFSALSIDSPKVSPGEGGAANLIDIEGGQNKTQVISISQQGLMGTSVRTVI